MSGYSATKAAQAVFAESLRSEFAGTDIHVSAVFPVSTTTEFREAMERDFGHEVSGLGPKQSVDHVAARHRRLHPPAAAEVYPHRASRGLADPQRHRAGVHRSPDAQVRPAARSSRRPSAATRTARTMSIETATAIARAGRATHGGRALIVGGWVRDRLLGRAEQGRRRRGLRHARGSAEDAARHRSAPVNTVGESFTVYKVARRRRVAAAPRVENRPRASRVRGDRRSRHVARGSGAAA